MYFFQEIYASKMYRAEL